MGGRVGLLDIDVYGPSLPLLVQPRDTNLYRSPHGAGMVYPLEHASVKLMSLGFVKGESGVPGMQDVKAAAIMRGPLVIKVVSQL
jgi:Mrp family chromosome partitioning ATPase